MGGVDDMRIIHIGVLLFFDQGLLALGDVSQR